MGIERITNQQDLSWFLDMYNTNKLDLEPPYQRRSVWTPKDRRFFLDTIFNNYPCPAIYLQKEITSTSYKYNVVDGKQRLQTIIDFYNNKIGLDAKFPDITIAGKKWKEIEKIQKYRNAFLNYRFSMEQLTSDVDDAGWNAVFDRVNRNQKTLKEQELRHAKFSGWFINFAEAQSEEDIWEKWKISSKNKQKRMKDVEFISILALILLEKNFIGFPQEKIDELYAKYDFNEDELKYEDEVALAPEDYDIDFTREKLETFIEEFNETKNTLQTLLDQDLLDLVSPKLMTYFYTLWTLVAFDRDKIIDKAKITEKLKKFFLLVNEQTKDPTKTDSPSQVLTFYTNAVGAATEIEPRKNRHNALKEFLFG